MAISKILIGQFWGKGCKGFLQYFWLLKKGTRTFSIRLNQPSRDILGSQGQYNHICKKIKINKHVSMIFLLAKNTKFQHFCR